MFSKQNVFFNVISIMVIGIVVLLLISRQRPVVLASDAPPVVHVVPHDKPATHPTLPKKSPFRERIPMTLRMASSKFREPAQLGRLLTKVLIEYGLTDKPLPPDKTEALPPLLTSEEWDYQDNFASYHIIKEYYEIHKRSKNLTEVEHQFYVQFMTTIGKESPVTFTRFAAAMYLANSAIPGLGPENNLPEKFPTSLEDVRQCYDSAFASLLDQTESLPDFELKMITFYLGFSEGLFSNFLMVEALSSTETTEKGIQDALNTRMKGIIDKLELVASRTKSSKRRETLNSLSQALKRLSSLFIPSAVFHAFIKKQYLPFAETLIAAVNDENPEAMLKHYLNPKPQLITQLKKSKSLRDEFSGTKNTTSLRLLDVISRGLAIEDEKIVKNEEWIKNGEWFKNIEMVKGQVFFVTLSLIATDSHGVKKNVQVKQDWVRQDGRWKIVNRNE